MLSPPTAFRNNGKVEYWNNGLFRNKLYFVIPMLSIFFPLFHHSIIPMLRLLYFSFWHLSKILWMSFRPLMNWGNRGIFLLKKSFIPGPRSVKKSRDLSLYSISIVA